MKSPYRMYSGTLVDLSDPDSIPIEPTSFIHALGGILRYNGATPVPISVARHSVMLARETPLALRRAALLHDWAEAIYGDIVTHLKDMMPQFRELEDALLKRIFRHHGVPFTDLTDLKEYDTRIRANEMLYCWGDLGDYEIGEPLPFDISHYLTLQYHPLTDRLQLATEYHRLFLDDKPLNHFKALFKEDTYDRITTRFK